MWVSRPGLNSKPTLISTTVKCQAVINSIPTVVILDSASEISLVSQSFATQLKVNSETWNCPPLTVASGKLFSIPMSCLIEVKMFSFTIKGRVGIVDGFSFKVLLGSDYLAKAPILIDIYNCVIRKPSRPVEGEHLPLLCVNVSMHADTSGVSIENRQRAAASKSHPNSVAEKNCNPVGADVIKQEPLYKTTRRGAMERAASRGS